MAPPVDLWCGPFFLCYFFIMNNVLVVGAGAVGAAYGWYSLRGGAKVTYLIKPKHRDQVENGIQLYLHPKIKGQADAIQFKEFNWLDNTEALHDKSFDLIILTVPSPALKQGDWLEALLKNLKPETTVLSLQPGREDADFILSKMPKAAAKQLVSGSIPIQSYWAPLPGETFAIPGYAFWLPPFAKQMLDAQDMSKAQKLALFFTKAGLPTKASKDFKKSQMGIELALQMIVAGLEKWDWSFDKLFLSQNIQLCSDAANEALEALSKQTKTPISFPQKLMVSGFVMKTLIQFLAKIAPFDLEAFLRVHFTKVETQMHEGMQNLIDICKKQRVSSTSLTLLAGRSKKPLQHEGSPTTATVP